MLLNNRLIIIKITDISYQAVIQFIIFLFEDVTAVCILEVFQNQQSMLLADKVLKQLGKEKAKEKYKVRM